MTVMGENTVIIIDPDLRIGRQIRYELNNETMLEFTHTQWANFISQEGTSLNKRMSTSIELLLEHLIRRANRVSYYYYTYKKINDNTYLLCLDTSNSLNLRKLLYKANVESSIKELIQSDGVEVEQAPYSNSCYFYYKKEKYRVSDHDNFCHCEYDIFTEDGIFNINEYK